MLEGAMAVVKPEMKSYIWLQTADGSIQQVEEEVAMFCPVIGREVLQSGKGSSKNYAISLPERVKPAVLGSILDYCRFHQVSGRSNKERKIYNEKFIRVETSKLCELASAADSLKLRPLVDLTSRALARMIEGKTPEEIREIFHLPDDLSEEEKLEPLRNITDDPHIRLLNRLYARKRNELRERQKLKVLGDAAPVLNPEVEKELPVDERSVDDLLSFINGDGDSKEARASKNKKKNRRRKDQPRKSLSMDENGCHKESNCFPFGNTNIEIRNEPSPKKSSTSPDLESVGLSAKLDLDDGDIYDEEVEDFARRLNSVWPERMQELIPSI
ncbi:hypothetical protein ACJIZ3_022279 [Penstemon smallii]|uniref:SKP1-like protein 21 n=1 Tax=Penstemon smallii TaxID=265156 RepID=A0ABD3TMY7_9LAMI